MKPKEQRIENSSRRVLKNPHSAARTRSLLGVDFEDSVGDAAEAYYINLRDSLLGCGLDITKGNQKILEIGSGDAIFINHLKNKGLDIVGIDARPRGKSDSHVLARIEYLPFRDNTFSVVVSLGTVFDDTIYNQDQDLMMREIYRVLKQDGIYIASNSREIKVSPIQGFDMIPNMVDKMWQVYKKS
jgi:SAM-dependent methyltransferase